MANIYKFIAFFLVVLLLFPNSNSTSNSTSSNCHRRHYYHSLQCNVADGVPEKLVESLEVDSHMRLPRIDPIKIGFTREIHHDGQIYALKTLSVRPPVFEIENFLSHDECDDLIEMAMSTGMETSSTVSGAFDEVLAGGNLRELFENLDANSDNSLDNYELIGSVQGINKDILISEIDLKEMLQTLDLNVLEDDKVTFDEFEMLTSPEVFKEIEYYLGKLEREKSSVTSRKSFSAFIDPYVDESRAKFFKKLHQRIAKITHLPIAMIRRSEALQVINYEVGGHYHAHCDSDDTEYAPCCHLMQYDDEEHCRPCRYATMFYYLNEPIEGGGTAFPFADNITFDDSKTSREEKHRLNLSNHCDKANLVYMPKKGAALFWYNHVIDDVTGWLGKVDEMSTHGGCDVLKGEKWAANNWINAGKDREADLEIWKYSENST